MTGSTQLGESHPVPEDLVRTCHSLVSAMVEGVVQQDAGGRVVFYNPSAARILGEPVGESFLAAFRPTHEHSARQDATDASGNEHPATLALRTAAPCTGAILGIRRGDIVTWVSVNSVPLQRPGEDAPYGVVSTVTDITGWYVEELAVRAREKVFRLLVENQNEGIGIVDLEERFLLTNHAGDEVFGVPPGGLVGRSLLDFLTPESRLSIENETKARIAGKRSRYELEIVRESDKALRTILVSAGPHFNDEGKISGSVGVFSDITDRIHVERALQENEARLRLTFDQAPIGAAMVGLDARYLHVNAAFCRMLGYQESELIGRWVAEVTHPEDAAGTEQNIRRIAQEPGASQYETEKRYLRKDGGVVWAHLTVTLLRPSSNADPYLLTMVQDITARKRAEADKARLQAQLLQSQKMESIGRLAGGVAHDFNNLLTVINGYSSTVLDLMNTEDPLRGHISEVYKAGERAAALVRQLLAFSRKQVLKPDRIDLNEMVADMEKMLRPLMGEDVEIVTTLAPALDAVLADRHQMEQVIMNLAVNARDAMPHGGKLSIETGGTVWDAACPKCGADVHPGNYVRISVRDTGTGIDDAIRQHLFEPFFTTKGVGHGTGLGLATVHGIVLQSGGHIDVDTSAEAGTTFHVYLPAAPGHVSALPAPEPGQPHGTGTILLVEDQPEVRRFVAILLRGCGYLVIESADGEEALEQCAQPVDLLLTDVVMPKMSGTELAARIRSIQPHVRVLFMSGYSDEVLSWPDDSRRGTAFIQKPFGLDALTAKVREVLRADEPSPPGALPDQTNLE